MVLHWRVQSFSDLSYMVLWIVVTLISGVDNSPFGSSSEHNSQSILQIATPVENHRLKRTIYESDSTVEKAEQVLNNGSDKNIFPKEGSQGFQAEEDTKIKQTQKQKYTTNPFKNSTTNKIKLESSSSALNKSFNDELKSSFYSVPKYSSTNKKDTKSNIYHTDQSSRANPSGSNQDNIDKWKPKLILSDNELNVAVVNNTREMNDQPVDIVSDLPLNGTDIVEDDSLLQNSSIHNASPNSTSADGRIMPTFEGIDIVLICSIILGTFLLLGVIGGSGYVVYRRRIWNKPQTLSDKCSNADSSGYIDDSTLRENSEEMYSLDNDSFLNSLEAMTIQNYWTDNVKHTKL